MPQRVLLSLAILFFPLFAFAHGTNFYEFGPDVSSRLRLQGLATPGQPFEARNDSVSGIDFWVDNPAGAGTFALELRSESGTLLASKTISVDAIPSQWAGTRLHAHFLSSLQ